MANVRALVLAVTTAACLSTVGVARGAEQLHVDGGSTLWHSPNIASAETNLVERSGMRLGALAYDEHFLNSGSPPAWDFLQRLVAPEPHTARLGDGKVSFPASGREVALDPSTLPDVATPAAPFLLGVPAADSILAVEPYYLFRNKQTAYRLSAFKTDGSPGPRFDSLPTHTIPGLPHVLVAPERAGCCENMTWSIRFYDLTSGTVRTFDCPPGRCGDLVFARPEPDGPLLVAYEVFETLPGIGSLVETQLFVVAPDGTPLAAGRLAHATHDETVGAVPDWAACASRVLAAEGSPYAVARLTGMRQVDQDSWAFRFDAPGETRTWIVKGVSEESRPSTLLASSQRN